jgi:hypothetical protein
MRTTHSQEIVPSSFNTVEGAFDPLVPKDEAPRAKRDTLNENSPDFIRETLHSDFGTASEVLELESLSSLSSSSSSSSPMRRSKDRAVSFDSTVTVYAIPSRSAYSDHIRCSLWISPMELQQNAARNYVEFAAEHWDWRQVTDDKDMIACGAGELVHPVHFAARGDGCNLGRHFLTVMSAQQLQR